MDEEVGFKLAAIGRLDRPHLLLLLPEDAFHLVPEPHVGFEGVLVSHALQVLPDLVTLAEGLGPADKKKQRTFSLKLL